MKFALRYPYTFYVLAVMMVFLGVSAIVVTPKDIFPVIDVPVVSVIWQYTGLMPQEMEQRVAQRLFHPDRLAIPLLRS